LFGFLVSLSRRSALEEENEEEEEEERKGEKEDEEEKEEEGDSWRGQGAALLPALFLARALVT